ncbi:MAG: OmpH family outer membrane protein [Akkermansiaceae bacterium]
MPSIDFVVRLALLLAITIILSADLVQGHEMKVASIDAGKVFSHWDYTIRFEDEVESREEALVATNAERIQVIKNLISKQRGLSERYQKNQNDMSVEKKAQMDESYKNLGREIKALERDRLDYLTQERTKLGALEKKTSQFILQRIDEFVKVYAKKQDYDMVVELGGETTANLPFFLHLEGAIDITDTIIMMLNQSVQPQPQKH